MAGPVSFGTFTLSRYSDSSFKGFVAWLGLDWLCGFWEQDPASLPCDVACGHFSEPPVCDKPSRNINVMELWPVVASIKRWGPHFHYTDNMQVLAMLTTGRSCNKMCMAWLREIFWLCFLWNLDIFPSYIKSAENKLADALSRLSYDCTPTKCWDLLCDFLHVLFSPWQASQWIIYVGANGSFRMLHWFLRLGGLGIAS